MISVTDGILSPGGLNFSCLLWRLNTLRGSMTFLIISWCLLAPALLSFHPRKRKLVLGIWFSVWQYTIVVQDLFEFDSTSDGSDTRNRIYTYLESAKNVLEASQTRLFFIFCQIFAIFDDCSKWSSPQKTSNMSKIWPKMKKSLVWLALNTFFGWYSGYPKIGFRVTVRVLLLAY